MVINKARFIMGLFVLSLFFRQTPSRADAVIWDLPLTEQPSGWTSDGWSFGSSGMACLLSCSGGYGYEQADVVTAYFPIPVGTDSLTLSINQDYSASWNDGFGSAEIYFRTDEPDSSWSMIWDLSYYGTTEDPVLLSITDVVANTSGQFNFRGVVSAGGGMSSYAGLHWVLSDLLLIANGNIQTLEPYSWAAIKASELFQR